MVFTIVHETPETDYRAQWKEIFTVKRNGENIGDISFFPKGETSSMHVYVASDMVQFAVPLVIDEIKHFGWARLTVEFFRAYPEFGIEFKKLGFFELPPTGQTDPRYVVMGKTLNPFSLLALSKETIKTNLRESENLDDLKIPSSLKRYLSE